MSKYLLDNEDSDGKTILKYIEDENINGSDIKKNGEINQFFGKIKINSKNNWEYFKYLLKQHTFYDKITNKLNLKAERFVAF